MNSYTKEILLITLGLTVTIFFIWFFHRKTQQQSYNRQIDVYAVIPDNCYAILDINRPSLFMSVMAENELVKEIMRSEIDAAYLSILLNYTGNNNHFITFHPQGQLYISKITPDQIGGLKEQLSIVPFDMYTPQVYEKYGIRFYYYPVLDNRFLGYYYQDGVFVAGMSRKLLEESARLLQEGRGEMQLGIDEARKKLDAGSVFNILLAGEIFNSTFIVNDSTRWVYPEKWWTADVFISEGNLCLFSSFDYPFAGDSLAHHVAGEITREINTYYPELILSTQFTLDAERYFYTGCLPLRSDSIPSGEE